MVPKIVIKSGWKWTKKLRGSVQKWWEMRRQENIVGKWGGGRKKTRSFSSTCESTLHVACSISSISQYTQATSSIG